MVIWWAKMRGHPGARRGPALLGFGILYGLAHREFREFGTDRQQQDPR